MVKHRTTASVALLAVLGTMLATAPPSAAATAPAVRLSGELVLVADQPGVGFAAIHLAGGSLVPINAKSVKGVASGSAVTVDVAVPADVRVAAAANRTLTNQSPGGRQIAVPLRSSDLAAASDGSPESLTTAIGKATVAEAMAPGTPALEVSKVVAAAADPVSTFTPATRQLYVAVVTPAGGALRQSVDENRIRAQVADASTYWSDVTGGALTLRVETITPQYISAYNCSNPWGMWDEAAERMGFPPHLPLPPNISIVIELAPGVSQNPSCGYGLGSIGQGPNDSGYLYTSDDAWPVLAHELGHNMSLMHADALLCPTVADSASWVSALEWTGTGCYEKPYGDVQDVMSYSSSGFAPFAPFLSAPQSLRVGFIPPSSATLIDTVGTRNVTLLPLAGRTGVRAAEVVNPTTDVHYYVEYRTKAGRDLKNVYNVNTGVRVLRFNPDEGTTVLLDPSPSGQAHERDPMLPVGGTFTSYDGRVRITTVSQDSANAVVSVTIGTSALAAPGAPTGVDATAGDTSAAVSWAAPGSDGGIPITGYTVTASPGGKTAATTGSRTATVTGLTNGTAYTFTVTATNAIGTSPASGASSAVTPLPAVDTATPTLTSFSLTGSPATPGGTISVSYGATDNSGALSTVLFTFTDPLGGEREIRLDGTPPTSGSIAQVIDQTWLNGTYRLSNITLYDPTGNGIGYGLGGGVAKQPAGASGPTSHTFNLATADFTVARAPNAPTAVNATAGNQQATVSWTAPASNGSPITSYTVTANPGGATATTTGPGSATVTGLGNDTSYTFTVIATNAVGMSLASTPSNAVTPIADVPDAPVSVSATRGDRSATVSWISAADGGSPVTSYTVTASPGGAQSTVAGTRRSATVTGLGNGTGYTFTVTAANAVGSSPASAPSSTVTPAAIPGAPDPVSATAGNRFATVSWPTPVSGGSAITGYTIAAAPGGMTVTTTGARTATVTGLTNGTAYTFTVTAANAEGAGAPSAPSAAVTPMTVPDAPVSVSATRGNRSAAVSWSAPDDDGGSPITDYTVTSNPAGATVTATGPTSAMVTGLSNGIAYSFTVAATNNVGRGPGSASNSVVPMDSIGPTVGLTGQPPAVTRSTGAQFFFAGADSSDAVVTLTYRCRLDRAADYTPCGSPMSFAGLTSGSHTFEVMAIDPSGNSSMPVRHDWLVDAVAPTVTLSAPAAAFTLTSSLVPAWTARDTGSGVANVDVRWARAPYSGRFGAWVYPSRWQKTTATRATLSGAARGYTYCFSARVRDKAGNTSAWSGTRCSAVALDDRSLSASSGWARAIGAAFYARTATVTTGLKKTLTRTRVQTRRIALVATRCARCGVVGVYWNGRLVRKISLYAASTQRRRVLAVTTFTGVRSGTLSVRTLTAGKHIQIDGLGLSRT